MNNASSVAVYGGQARHPHWEGTWGDLVKTTGMINPGDIQVILEEKGVYKFQNGTRIVLVTGEAK